MKTEIPTNMYATIRQILYPNRQAFFKKLALNLPSQPAIRISPAPLPSGARRAGSRNMRKAVPAVLGPTKHAGKAEALDKAATGDVLEQ